MKNQFKEEPLHPTSKGYPKIRAHENLYAILEHALDLLCVIDKDGCFVLVNSAAQRMLGYHESELLRTAYSKLVYQDDLVKTEAVALETMAGKDVLINACLNAGIVANFQKSNGVSTVNKFRT